MASINEKLNYINETKNLIKEELNKLGSEITNEIPFREYVNKIQTLYNEWPKITEESTILTLNNTKKNNMKLILKGNLAQEETNISNGNDYNSPSPDHPQDVQVVTGTKEIKILSKNFFNQISVHSKNNCKYTYNNGVYTVTFTGTGNAQIFFNIDIPAGTYTYSGPTYYSAQIWKSRFGAMLVNNIASTNKTFTINERGTILCFNWASGTSTDTISFNTGDIQIEKNSTATSYQSYQSQTYPITLGSLELCKIGDYQDYIYKNNNKWYKYSRIGKKQPKLTTSSVENIFMDNTSWTNEYLTQQAYCKYFKNVVNTNIINNDSASTYLNENDFSFRWGATHDRIYIKSSLTLSEIKALNIEIYYLLATPFSVEITDTTLINQLNTLEQAISYNNQTNIFQTDNNLPFIINATAFLKNSN